MKRTFITLNFVGVHVTNLAENGARKRVAFFIRQPRYPFKIVGLQRFD